MVMAKMTNVIMIKDFFTRFPENRGVKTTQNVGVFGLGMRFQRSDRAGGIIRNLERYFHPDPPSVE